MRLPVAPAAASAAPNLAARLVARTAQMPSTIVPAKATTASSGS